MKTIAQILNSTSNGFFNVGFADLFKATLLAFITGIVTFLAQSLEAKQFTFDFTTIWHVGAAAAISYIAKNLATPKDPAK